MVKGESRLLCFLLREKEKFKIDQLTPQQKEELEVFFDFLEVSPEPIIKGSIEPRLPPHPDIFCNIEGKVQVGFELVRLTNFLQISIGV